MIINRLFSNTSNLIKQKLLNRLTPQQKQITAIVTLIFGAIALGFFLGRRFKAQKQSKCSNETQANAIGVGVLRTQSTAPTSTTYVGPSTVYSSHLSAQTGSVPQTRSSIVPDPKKATVNLLNNSIGTQSDSIISKFNIKEKFLNLSHNQNLTITKECVHNINTDYDIYYLTDKSLGNNQVKITSKPFEMLVIEDISQTAQQDIYKVTLDHSVSLLTINKNHHAPNDWELKVDSTLNSAPYLSNITSINSKNILNLTNAKISHHWKGFGQHMSSYALTINNVLVPLENVDWYSRDIQHLFIENGKNANTYIITVKYDNSIEKYEAKI